LKKALRLNKYQLDGKESRDIVRTDGFKVIQTPLSNRIFLIGGNSHPYGTYEFDLQNKRFFDEMDDDDMPRIFVPLGLGRSYHSLVATSGLIYCTGGLGDYLKREDGYVDEEDNEIPKIVEVLKLKDKMWVEYTNLLRIARYCHSTTIMGDYLYLIHGYDACERGFNHWPVERIKIDLHDHFCYGDSQKDTGFNIGNDDVDRFFRWFTTVAPVYNNTEIIVFGYDGLESKRKTAKEQESYEKTQPCQKIKQYHAYDIGVRFKEVSNLLQWEKTEEKKAWEDYKDKKELCKIQGGESAKHNIKEIEEPSVL